MHAIVSAMDSSNIKLPQTGMTQINMDAIKP